MTRVLYIEDNPDDVVRVREMLAQHALGDEFVLETADRLASGLQRLTQGGIDLVLLDYHLPDGRGVELVTTVQRQAPSLPIVVFTAMVTEEKKALYAFKAGVQDYLVKEEVEGRLLVRAIRYALERKRLDKLKDEIISIASHEVKTPIAIVQGNIQNLKDGLLGELNDQQKKALTAADDSIRRLNRLIDNMLTVSRFEAGRGEPKKKPIEPLAFLKRVMDEHKVLIEQHHLQLQTRFSENLPTIEADPDMIVEMINNLLSNALRYAKSKIVIDAEAAVERGKNFVRIGIGNDGPPIAPEDQKKLFEKFIQLNRPEGGSGYKGTGLGLAICKKIVEAHTGRIWVECQKGGLTTFCFTLPEWQP